MTRQPDMLECTDEAARLLPWFVNGTLSTADAGRVSAHLDRCQACRAAAAELGRVRTLLRSPAQVEYTPQAGFRKLMARIDEMEREYPAPAPAPKPVAVVPHPARRPSHGHVRWLAAAVVVQAVALGAIGGAHFLARPAIDDAPRYRTLTSAAPVVAAGPRLRVVFAPATTLAELNDLLHANQLVVVAGPSDAGIYTLALHSSPARRDAQDTVLARLRADPRVRFAEPLGAEAPAR